MVLEFWYILQFFKKTMKYYFITKQDKRDWGDSYFKSNACKAKHAVFIIDVDKHEILKSQDKSKIPNFDSPDKFFDYVGEILEKDDNLLVYPENLKDRTNKLEKSDKPEKKKNTKNTLINRLYGFGEYINYAANPPAQQIQPPPPPAGSWVVFDEPLPIAENYTIEP